MRPEGVRQRRLRLSILRDVRGEQVLGHVLRFMHDAGLLREWAVLAFREVRVLHGIRVWVLRDVRGEQVLGGM